MSVEEVLTAIIEKITAASTLDALNKEKQIAGLEFATGRLLEGIHQNINQLYQQSGCGQTYAFDSRYPFNNTYIQSLQTHAYCAAYLATNETDKKINYLKNIHTYDRNNFALVEFYKIASGTYETFRKELDTIFGLTSVNGRFLDLVFIMRMGDKEFSLKIEPAYKLFEAALTLPANREDKGRLEAVFAKGTFPPYSSLDQFRNDIKGSLLGSPEKNVEKKRYG